MPKLSRIWWTPLAFVVGALLLLLIVPLLVGRQVSVMRERLTNGSEHGRVLVNDLEAGFASQLLAPPGRSTDTIAVPTPAHLRDEENELRATAERIGPGAAARYAELHALLADWNTRPHDGPGDPASAARASDILGAAERLDNYLVQETATQRADVGRITRYNIISAVVMAPIALVAVILVIWSGDRVVRFASAAEERRLEVVRAAETRASLLRGVTHDVKNPLGAASGYAQLLEEGVVGQLAPPQIDMVRRIRRLVDQSVDTVTDLLELARADSGGLQVEYAHTDLATLTREVVDDNQGSAVESAVSLDVAGEPTPIVTDPRRVRQILANLVSNAIKYTPSGGAVHVSVVRDGQRKESGNGTGETASRVGVRVVDDGPGIPAELRSRVFEEFFRVSADETAARGNGLGLAISRRIAQLLGGDVTFQPGDGRGSVFTLWLDANASNGEAPRRTIS